MESVLRVHHIGVWSWNRATGSQVWSDGLFRLLGYVPGSVVPSKAAWRAVIHPEDQAWLYGFLYLEPLRDVESFVYRVVRSGEVRWIRETWRQVATADGPVVFGTSIDVTDLTEREQFYSIADNWLKLVVNSARVGLWNCNGDVYHWDETFFELLGYSPGEVEPSAHAWSERIHPEDRHAVETAINSAYEDERDVRIEYRILLPGGAERWVEERGTTSSQFSSVRRGILIDITDRKRLQIENESARQRLQLALDTGKMGFWTGDGDEEHWDAQTYRILGYQPFSVKASFETFIAAVHPDDRPKLRKTDGSAVISNDLIVQDYRIILPDGSERWLESTRRLGGQSYPQRYGVVVDITERKKQQEVELNNQKLVAAAQLLRGLGHDFNNFLALISAALEQVGQAVPDPELQRRITDAQKVTQAGALFSRRLINVSDQRVTQPLHLSVGEQIDRLVGMFRHLLRRDVELLEQCGPELWNVMVDPVELDCAVINLLLNARDAIVAGGTITVIAANQSIGPGNESRSIPAGDYVVITISDSGRGMDEETLSKATEPFFTTKERGSGTGLGLSSVASFTRAAKGFISIESQVGAGTSVSMFLPRSHDAARDDPGPERDVKTGEGQLILVVDDDRSVRETLMQRVEGLGYSVEEAHSGEMALDHLRRTPEVALVLSDVGMPEPYDGWTLRDRLETEMPHLPVILISADEYLSTTRGDVLSKFCTQAQLGHALAEALSRIQIMPLVGGD